ncbi:hypothetical protein AX17_001571 [Amanita inopinata Kibby_2008]|nr:hypothetical protein AX17_001571 [Amanita inopinata Kibby_2008]
MLFRVEPAMYAVVNLQRPHTKQLFLRTIETSRTKKASFFATHVKTLCIAYDPNTDDGQTARIISVCRGVVDLTFLSISVVPKPTTESYSLYQRGNRAVVDRINSGFPVYNAIISTDSSSCMTKSFEHNKTAMVIRKRNALCIRSVLAQLRPAHMSVLFPVSGPEVDGSSQTDFMSLWSTTACPSPSLPITLNLSLLSHTTHLSIQNRWEDWVAWSGCFEFARLPYLTHLSLDLRAGFSAPSSKTACYANEGFYGGFENPNDAVFPEMDSSDGEKACILARAAQCVLTQCPRLRVCALRLIFDSNPDRTAAAILAQMPLVRPIPSEAEAKAKEKEKGRGDEVVKKEEVEREIMGEEEEEEEEEEDGEDGEDEEDSITEMVDPRLVFLWDKEPFQARDAHGLKERQMWTKAEEAVGRQSIGLGGY